ncbi:MAG: hypothetical protein ABSH22_22615 [Tepidisphaeraceae bacterium]
MSHLAVEETAGASRPSVQPTSQMPPPTPHRFAVRKPFYQRINPRAAVLAGIALLFIGGPFYVWARGVIDGGIINEGDYFHVDLKAMSSFNLDQVNGTPNDVPARFRELEGKRVLLDGQMWAPTSAGSDSVNYFQLVYSITKCCFNGPPLAQHFVDANVVPGRVVYNYGQDPIHVWGTLHIRFRKEPGGVIKAVYEVDVDKVEEM